MKRNVKLFEEFKLRDDVRPAQPDVRPEPSVDVRHIEEDAPVEAGPAENISFDPMRAGEYSFKDDKDRLVVDANFGEGSFINAFHPNEGREVLWLMPNGVEEVGYIGHSDDAGWRISFKKGTTFEQAWNTLRDHEGSIMLTFKRLGSNKTWGFEGFAPMEDTGIQMENK